MRDHPATDDEDLRGQATASATTSRNTPRLSRRGFFVITSGGQIFTVPPPNPTGENISTPFSMHLSTIRAASGPSGSFVPGLTHATPATRPLPSTQPICLYCLLNDCSAPNAESRPFARHFRRDPRSG